MKSTTIVSVAALLALAGCVGTGGKPGPTSQSAPAGQTQPKEKQTAKACHGQRCVVTVTVSNCVVNVDPYFLVMTNRSPITVVWEISGNGSFAPNPIRWKELGAARVFSPAKATEKSVEAANSGTQGIYHYGVTVRDGGRTCPELDPTGVNDMGQVTEP